MNGDEPDVVLACAGDVPTIEICAASWLLQKHVPGIKVRVVNVVDLMTLMFPDKHAHGMDEMSFNALFTEKRTRDLRLSTTIAGSFIPWCTGVPMKAASMCTVIWITEPPPRLSTWWF
jgi:phosphoketolase